MKIVRDNLGHICQINYDDGSEIKNEKEAYDFIIADETKITERYKIDAARQKNRCIFWQNVIPDIIDAISSNIINQQNQLANDNNINTDDASSDNVNSEEEYIPCHLA